MQTYYMYLQLVLNKLRVSFMRYRSIVLSIRTITVFYQFSSVSQLSIWIN